MQQKIAITLTVTLHQFQLIQLQVTSSYYLTCCTHQTTTSPVIQQQNSNNTYSNLATMSASAITGE